ncbi:MAG: hypothetical protein IPP74_15135 [Alphaproteobacteria bacterium]|nr:hypothetical protein [Alphaproteobacteria bacterium]
MSQLFTGTANKCAFRSDDTNGTRLYLRVDDSQATNIRLRGYESISDQSALDGDTNTNPFPTNVKQSGGMYAIRLNRPWWLYSDSRAFYFISLNTAGSSSCSIFFGDIVHYAVTDQYGCGLIAATAGAPNESSLLNLNSGTGSRLARNYSGSSLSINGNRYSNSKSSSLGTGGMAYPSIISGQFHAWPVEIWDTTVAARGLMPGLWNPIHAGDIANGTIIDGVPALSGRTLVVQLLASLSGYACAFDITGPWR